ncbi:MAG: RnfABCDGE type electron transport complex subunit D [Rikenellaceae bacterium]|jgi:electron transport complex protein RnfD|nr:RnfABCDGE type electron transport complex subunit D [Rikenellaceae bacterium]
MADSYIVSGNPHWHAPVSTRKIMLDVIIALSPALIVSFLFYGWSAIFVMLESIAFCVLTEWAITKFLMKKPSTIGDLSAVVTGILLAMTLPADMPWWIVLIGALVSIGVAKMTFGGIGQNIFNPAIVGRVFLLISFPAQMTTWPAPNGFIKNVDAFSGATLLQQVQLLGADKADALVNFGTLFENIGGSAGEISALALLVGWIYLLCRKVVKPWITISIFATVAVIAGIFHSIDPMTYTGPIFNLLTGGIILGSCFMANDYVTSPMNDWGGVLYGFGIGFILMMIRYFGSYPEGMAFAILIMNMTVPLINRAFHQRKYGRK